MKAAIPKGTRDFGPETVNKRNFIFNTLKQVFVKYGFQPIETPTMENLSTLTGKYGEEGDQLLFKVLNSGDFLKDASSFDNPKKLTFEICSKGLRYDLTVPFARYVVMNQNDIAFPFKRYQIQPVWRADRPQRGRYREFYQCDVDTVGSTSLINEVEFIQIYDEGFAKLGIDVTIKINNRKILAGLAEVANIEDQFIAMTIAIDKLDKIGIEGVRKDMLAHNIPEAAVQKIEAVLTAKSLEEVKTVLGANETGLKGIAELETVFDYLKTVDITNTVEFDVTLARGLNYYTGAIFEVKANDVELGSIGGGGRYDDLTGNFGLKGVPGVGVSFGADRIYLVMEELNLFPETSQDTTQVILLAMDDESHKYAFQQLQLLRKAGINAELYPEVKKFKKQMKYANARKVPYIAIVGEDERKDGVLGIKNMKAGTQENMTTEALINQLT